VRAISLANGNPPPPPSILSNCKHSVVLHKRIAPLFLKLSSLLPQVDPRLFSPSINIVLIPAGDKESPPPPFSYLLFFFGIENATATSPCDLKDMPLQDIETKQAVFPSFPFPLYFPPQNQVVGQLPPPPYRGNFPTFAIAPSPPPVPLSPSSPSRPPPWASVERVPPIADTTLMSHRVKSPVPSSPPFPLFPLPPSRQIVKRRMILPAAKPADVWPSGSSYQGFFLLSLRRPLPP